MVSDLLALVPNISHCAELLIKVHLITPASRFSVDEYSAIAPPIMPVLFTKNTDPVKVIELE